MGPSDSPPPPPGPPDDRPPPYLPGPPPPPAQPPLQPPPPTGPSAYGLPPSAYPPAAGRRRAARRGPVDGQGRPLAEWSQRLGAVVIDELFIWVMVYCAVYLFGLRDSFGGAVLSLLMAGAYYAVLNGSALGQTFGKRVFGIQVRDAAGAGGTIGVRRAALRYVTVGLFRVVPFFLLFTILDGLWPLWDRHRQALHDKIAGSVVVRVSRSSRSAPPAPAG